MASPVSSSSATGRPSLTDATSEFVVPRSIPMARVVPGAQAAFSRASPGSRIWNNASGKAGLPGGGRRLVVGIHLLEEAAQIADLDQVVCHHLERPQLLARALALPLGPLEPRSDPLHHGAQPRADILRQLLHVGVVPGGTSLGELLAQLEDLAQERR